AHVVVVCLAVGRVGEVLGARQPVPLDLPPGRVVLRGLSRRARRPWSALRFRRTRRFWKAIIVGLEEAVFPRQTGIDPVDAVEGEAEVAEGLLLGALGRAGHRVDGGEEGALLGQREPLLVDLAGPLGGGRTEQQRLVL